MVEEEEVNASEKGEGVEDEKEVAIGEGVWRLGRWPAEDGNESKNGDEEWEGGIEEEVARRRTVDGIGGEAI